jgi:PAS domain-containing protein
MHRTQSKGPRRESFPAGRAWVDRKPTGHAGSGISCRFQRTKVSSVSQTQKPLELILARNLMSALSTPAFLVDEGGLLVFYNEAAGMLLGKRFEELGTVGAQEWGAMFGPFDESGEPIPYDELPLVVAVRNGRPAHGSFEICSAEGNRHTVEVSAFPILTAHGTRGAIAVFWPSSPNGSGESA